jgi:hypothetical protein
MGGLDQVTSLMKRDIHRVKDSLRWQDISSSALEKGVDTLRMMLYIITHLPRLAQRSA